MKLGSLFDGSGGFPLAGTLCGIDPVWAAEVEPYPIAVTSSRFPKMRHLGSVTDIYGGEIEPVDIITFGSPCQDLSVAGKRAGLKHEANGDEETTRSGLFMEAVRIIKEMREATNGRYPTFAVWENVPGAFSSNQGEDFRIVLEELIKIVEPRAVMPAVPKGGWAYADYYCGDGWSIGYRVFDAQYWGVPQRRRRIYLVADFRGQRSREILFEFNRLPRNLEESRTPWQGIAPYVERSVGADDREGVSDVIPINTMIATRHKQLGRGTGFGVGEVGDPQFTISSAHEHAVAYAVKPVGLDGYNATTDSDHIPCVVEPVPYTLKIRSGCEGGGKGALIQTNLSATLGTSQDQRNYVVEPIAVATQQGGAEVSENGVCPTITATAGMSGNNQPWICAKTYDARGNRDGDTVSTLTGDHENRITDYTSVVVELASFYPQMKAESQCFRTDGVANTIVVGTNPGFHNGVVESIAIDRAAFNQGQNAQYDPQFYTDGTVSTLVAKGPSAVAYKNVRYIVRRLTPTECARLQGFPDRWGDIDHKADFTDAEYAFWLNVRNTHAAINGKAVKEYTKEQMLKWYNKLHTDSAEYKMWGNGIALPCALYVMEGIAEVARGELMA